MPSQDASAAQLYLPRCTVFKPQQTLAISGAGRAALCLRDFTLTAHFPPLRKLAPFIRWISAFLNTHSEVFLSPSCHYHPILLLFHLFPSSSLSLLMKMLSICVIVYSLTSLGECKHHRARDLAFLLASPCHAGKQVRRGYRT